MDGWGSVVRERKGNRGGLIWEWAEGEQGQGWIDGGVG